MRPLSRFSERVCSSANVHGMMGTRIMATLLHWGDRAAMQPAIMSSRTAPTDEGRDDPLDMMLIMLIFQVVPHGVVLYEKQQRRQEGAERLKPLHALASAWAKATAALPAFCNCSAAAMVARSRAFIGLLFVIRIIFKKFLHVFFIVLSRGYYLLIGCCS